MSIATTSSPCFKPRLVAGTKRAIPNHLEPCVEMAASLEANGDNIRIDGPYYQEVIRRAHEVLKPRTYFEIGSLHGDTLRLASCAAIAVDPVNHLRDDVLIRNPFCQFYEETSDAFFAAHDPKKLLGRRIELAFLDGMHEFPFLLRDFINAERNCRRGSMILLHDCLPGDAHMTRLHSELGQDASTNFPGWWTGDVWKMVPVLRQMRPDLQVTCLDAPPTGLVAITGLDPESRILSDSYDALLAEWAAVRLQQWGVQRLLTTAYPQPAEAWLGTLRPFGFADRVQWELRRARRKLGALKRRFTER